MGRALLADFGRDHTTWMQQAPLPLGAMFMVQEIPHDLSRVSIDPVVRDRFGMPVARLRGAGPSRFRPGCRIHTRSLPRMGDRTSGPGAEFLLRLILARISSGVWSR